MSNSCAGRRKKQLHKTALKSHPFLWTMSKNSFPLPTAKYLVRLIRSTMFAACKESQKNNNKKKLFIRYKNDDPFSGSYRNVECELDLYWTESERSLSGIYPKNAVM